ncbi:MAG: four helix bundle protein [Alistipes sp.]|nr:four helix bundle protein [Alistipes sp.]
MRDFRKYDVWNLAVDFSTSICTLTENFPVNESYGLTVQLRRASVSIASNIAEGASRSSELDFCRFLEIALGSAFEVETQLIISAKLEYITPEIVDMLLENIHTIQKKLNNLIQTIKLH